MTSAERAAKNESLFRELNEALEAATTGAPGEVRGFVCECSDVTCTQVVAVPLGSYEEIRTNPERFVVAPDEAHVDPRHERVVERHEEFWVVEKFGVAGDVASDLDPNS